MKLLELSALLLAPPGEGVFTVSNSKERKASLQKKLYDSQDVRKSWLESLGDIGESKLCLLGVPSDCGGGILRGANWGPLFVREALLKTSPYPALDLGDVRVVPHLLHDEMLNEKTIRDCRKALYQDEAIELPVSPLSITESYLDQFYREHPTTKVFAIGGDHSVSYPLVRSWARSRPHKKRALLHFDAHTDLLESRLGIRVSFGSWTFHVREFFPHKDLLVQVGIRSTGKERSHWENALGLTQYWPDEVKKLGAKKLAHKIIEQYHSQQVEEVYLSFDIDALDAQWAQATGTPEGAGLDPVTCCEIIRTVAAEFPITGADLVEVAPLVNHDFKPNTHQELTLISAASLARVMMEVMTDA